MKLTIQDRGIDHKPTLEEYRLRVRRMFPIDTENLYGIAHIIAFEGYAYRDVYMVGIKQDGYISQDLLTLDFDDGIPVEETLKRCEMLQLKPYFGYYTFSHTPDKPRYRIVFRLDSTITDIRLSKTLRLAINILFPDADQIKSVIQVYQDSNKGGIGVNVESTISPHEVILEACEIIKINAKHGNFSRDLKSKLGLKSIPGSSKKLVSLSNMYNSVNTKNDEVVQYEFPYTEEEAYKSFSKDEKKELEQHFDFDYLFNNCKLYHDSLTLQYWPDYHDLFFLASSLKQFKGGQKKMKELLDRVVYYHRSEYRRDQCKNLENMLKSCDAVNGRCDTRCPFYEECKIEHIRECQPLKRGEIKKLSGNKGISLFEAEYQLRCAIDYAFESNVPISVIKADTGLGKTEMILNTIKNKSVTIAVPTHRLKDEIFIKAKEKRLKLQVVPELNIELLPQSYQKQYLKYISLGDYSSARYCLIDFIDNSTDVNAKWEIEQYLNLSTDFGKGKLDNVIVTHSRLMQTNSIKSDYLIIDEDILIKEVVKTPGLSYKELKKVSNVPGGVCEQWLNTVLTAEEKQFTLLPILNRKNISSFIQAISCTSKKYSFNLRELLKARFVYRCGDRLSFGVVNTLPKAKKTIILSATAEESIYKRVFPICEFLEVDHCKPTGKVKHFTGLPSSRYGLSRGKGLLENFELIKEVLPSEDIPIISFKKYENELIKQGLNVAATLGATDGIDEYKGQDIAVIGTYHYDVSKYLCFAKCISDDVNVVEGDYIPITYNGFEFYNYSYEDDFLRACQLYLINSEMTQAVGRARITRENATVYLVSSFPVIDSEIINL